MENNSWVWPTCETVHFIGLSMLFGVVLTLDLRMLGVGKNAVSFAALYQLLPLGMLGFTMNLITGMMFFVAMPKQYTGFLFFLKMMLVVFGALNVLYFMLCKEPWTVREGDDAGNTGQSSSPPRRSSSGLPFCSVATCCPGSATRFKILRCFRMLRLPFVRILPPRASCAQASITATSFLLQKIRRRVNREVRARISAGNRQAPGCSRGFRHFRNRRTHGGRREERGHGTSRSSPTNRNAPVKFCFHSPYLEVEAGYLVPAGSPIQDVAEVDSPGIRIGIATKSAYDLFLTRTLRHAMLFRATGMAGSYELFVNDGLDVLAGIKPWLAMMVEKIPGSRVLDGRFMAVQQCIGTPRGRAAGAKFLNEFVEDGAQQKGDGTQEVQKSTKALIIYFFCCFLCSLVLRSFTRTDNPEIRRPTIVPL